MATSDIKKGPLYVDSTNNRVGIGTTSPTGNANANAVVLEVNSSGANPPEILAGGQNAEISIAGGSSASYLWSTGAYPLIMATNATERMRIDSNGNAAIGSAADAGNALRYFDIYNTNTGANAGSILRLITSNAAGSGTATGELLKYKSGLLAIVNTEPSATANTAFYVAGSERLRIDSSGRVTMPYQPCASVSYGGGDITSTTVISLNNNPITRGGITISSNRFTVPVGGTYVVGYHHLATNTGTQIAIRKNGADINSGAGAYTQINPGAAHGNGSVQNLVALSTSDYIEFVVTGGVCHGNSNYNRMYIYLLG